MERRLTEVRCEDISYLNSHSLSLEDFSHMVDVVSKKVPEEWRKTAKVEFVVEEDEDHEGITRQTIVIRTTYSRPETEEEMSIRHQSSNPTKKEIEEYKARKERVQKQREDMALIRG